MCGDVIVVDAGGGVFDDVEVDVDEDNDDVVDGDDHVICAVLYDYYINGAGKRKCVDVRMMLKD